MILKTYLFSQNSGNYQQYTSDHSENFIRAACKNCKEDNQIAIHRDGNLIYYTYVHRASQSDIFGICIVCGEVCMNPHTLFEYLQKTIEYQANKGVLFHYDENGIIRKTPESFANEPAEIDTLFREIKQYLEKKSTLWEPLPPEDLSIPITSCMVLSFADDNKTAIVDAIRHYHNVYISMENSIPTSFSKTVARLNSENRNLRAETQSLSYEISKLKNQQRNTLWVSLLSLTVLVMGFILYFKVINPSEVSKYQTEEFVYYGPLKNKKPHGEGVAFYPSNDKYGRRYYIGNFVNGERQDSTAMLYYQNGDYYYGSMHGDNWEHGLFYSNSDNSHFKGDFVDNNPSDGVWYNHEFGYRIKNEKRISK